MTIEHQRPSRRSHQRRLLAAPLRRCGRHHRPRAGVERRPVHRHWRRAVRVRRRLARIAGRRVDSDHDAGGRALRAEFQRHQRRHAETVGAAKRPALAGDRDARESHRRPRIRRPERGVSALAAAGSRRDHTIREARSCRSIQLDLAPFARGHPRLARNSRPRSSR